jgi:hypothetical protein
LAVGGWRLAVGGKMKIKNYDKELFQNSVEEPDKK